MKYLGVSEKFGELIQYVLRFNSQHTESHNVIKLPNRLLRS